jgi:aminocarboxymuconate-semialdehyde decarboxylase
MITDVHRHLVPSELASLLFSRPEYGVERLRAEGHGIDVTVNGRLFRLSREFFEAERQYNAMRAQGIDHAVLSLATPFLAPQIGADAARAAATTCNDGFGGLIAQAGSTWDAWAFLPLQDPAFCARELEQRVAQGFRGGHIATSCNGAYLPDPRYTPLIEAAVALDVPLFMHPADPPGRDRTEDYQLTVVAGYLFESTVSVLRMVCSGFLDRWPTLKLLVPHVGGYAVTLRDRMQREVDTNPDIVLAAPVGDYLRRLWFDTICFEPAVLAAVAEIVGTNHLLLGSDAPFALGEPDPVGFVRRSLPQAALPAVFETNWAALALAASGATGQSAAAAPR